MKLTRGSLYKSFTSTPYKATDIDGKVVSLRDTLSLLKQDIQDITDLAQWEYDSYNDLLQEVDNIISDKNISAFYKRPSFIGRTLNLRLPDWFHDNRKSGKSRANEIYSDVIVRHVKSELERHKVNDGTSDKYVSSGWKRTANGNKSVIGKKISLSSADKQYSYIDNDPLQDGYISLVMVIKGDRYNLFFDFNKDRFAGGVKVTLPDITIDKNNRLHFYFTVEYEYIYKDITSDYIVGVDVGKTHYATITVTDKNSNIVHTTTLSRRVHTLENSIKATSNQIIFLRRKLERLYPWDDKYKDIYHEIEKQRKKNINKKKQLAIIAAQEIAYISYLWNNAVVCFEDLSWIVNTMQNGRWNRGELVRRTTEYVELNGSRVIKVNASYTSKKCYRCKSDVCFVDHHTAYCDKCSITIDRDINAAANISFNGKKTIEKISATRRKAKKYKNHKNSSVLRTPVIIDSLCYKSVKNDRRKNTPTGKCDNKKKGKQYKLKVREYQRLVKKEVLNDNYGAVTHNDDVTVLTDGNTKAKDYQDSKKATKNYIDNYCELYDLSI